MKRDGAAATSNTAAGLKSKALLFAFILALAIPALFSAPAALPPQQQSGQGDRVFLEHADLLTKASSDSFMVLTGSVRFRKDSMLMYCDSAHFYPESESFDAFGNVHMEQGDTLFVFADSMHYRHQSQLATLYGEPVRMINRDVELRTDEFIYDMMYDYGYYRVGGSLTDANNHLVSLEGEYVPSSKEATFYVDVALKSITEGKDTLHIYTDTLYYNTVSHLAELTSPSMVVSKADTIFTSHGLYNTDTQIADLYDRSLVKMGRGTTLTGDTLFYDKAAGYGWARGNMAIIDSIRQSALCGDYGYYDQIADSSYVTGRALALEYSRGDTLYMHGREIYSIAVTDTLRFEADTIAGTPAYEVVDTTHVVICHPRVRFYRSDMQGVCDSLRFEEKDSVLYMHRHPIVWSDDRQIFGNLIELHLNDSTIDMAVLPDFGFTAQHVEGEFFNQLTGKEMIAYFDNDELSRLDVNGNVEAIMLPMENDSTYNKIINITSSFLTADFLKQKLQRMKMWPETSGTVTPLYLAKKSLFYLSKFKWFDGIRPESPDDIFIIPPQMEELMLSAPEASTTFKRAARNNPKTPKQQ